MADWQFFQLTYADGATRHDQERTVLRLVTEKGSIRGIELSMAQVAEIADRSTFMLRRYVRENS